MKQSLLCERCRMFLGVPQLVLSPDDDARYVFTVRLGTRTKQLGGSLKNIRETVQRELRALK